MKKLSVVVPVYNEAAGLKAFYGQLQSALVSLKLPAYEVILVNDGSNDDSSTRIAELHKEHPQTIKVIDLTRNFGKEAALSAGLHQATGDVVLSLDADGQHPPAKIVELLDRHSKGFEMVVGRRTDMDDQKTFKKLGNKLYYRLLKFVGAHNLQPGVTDFRVMSRAVVDEFNKLSERRRITRGLLDWMGFSTAYVDFTAPERLAGTATYSNTKLFFLAIDSILSNSRKPLAVALIVESFITTIGALGVVFIVLEKYILRDPWNLKFSGPALLVMVAVTLLGVVLMGQGVISLYLARIYEETQARPLYIEKPKR